MTATHVTSANLTTSHATGGSAHVRRAATVLRALRRDGVRVAARRVPAGRARGDLLFAHRLAPRRWLLVIGDAMGSGAAAEELAEAVRAAVLRGAARSLRPAEILRDASSVVQRVGDGRFMSLLVFDVDAARRTVRLANAGHVEPLAAGRSGGVVALEGHAPALGIVPEFEYRDAGPLRLPPHVTLLAVTDGVTEAQDVTGVRFGREGVASALAAARTTGVRGVVRTVLADMEAHAGPDRHDVATVVALRFD